MIELILKQVPILDCLSEAQLQKLVQGGETISLESGEIVYHEGDEANSMHIIVDGKVRIYKCDSQGNEVDLKVMKTGDFIGEFAMLDNQPRSASVSCLTACSFFVLNREHFLELLLSSDRKMLNRVFITLTDRMRNLNEKYFKEELAKQALQTKIEEERHRSLAQLVTGMAHELNTPLGLINSTVDMIEELVSSSKITTLLNSDDDSKEILDEILEATDITKRNVTKLHSLTQKFKKMSSHQLMDTKETVNLPELMDDIIELFKINNSHTKLIRH